MNEPIQPPDLLSAKASTGYGSPVGIRIANKICFQAILRGTSGAVTATVKLYGTMDDKALTDPANAALELLATFTLSGTGAGADVHADSGVWPVEMPYRWFIGQVDAISGTGANATLLAGV